MSQRSRDLKFSSDDDANKTMVLDLGDEIDNLPPPDDEATVVLDLSSTQVDKMLHETAPALARNVKR